MHTIRAFFPQNQESFFNFQKRIGKDNLTLQVAPLLRILKGNKKIQKYVKRMYNV